MSQISITRALAELKLLDSRITNAINSSNFVSATKKSSKNVNGVVTKDQFVETAKSDYQSIVTLIERRKKIKSAIVASNAVTLVKIGEKDMTVADAIERKNNIGYDKYLLEKMENSYNYAVAAYQRENEKVQANVDQLLLTTFGKEGKQKVSGDEIEVISKPYKEQNEFEVINPLNILEKVNALKADIENFEMEVDFVLSTSNAITLITID